MKYFSKYLPVEGEINEGDKFLDHKDNLIKDAHIPEFYNNPHVPYFDGYKKVKLFLCSGDIKPEDFASRESRVHVSFNNPEPPFKIIGEIFPDARWVKEGDEFLGPEAGEKCEVLPLHRHDVVTEEMIFVDKYGEQVETPIYLIKGPCGHFH